MKNNYHYAPEFYQDEYTLVYCKLECIRLLLLKTESIECNQIGSDQQYLTSNDGDLEIDGILDKLKIFSAVNFIKERHELECDFILKLEISDFEENILIAEDSHKKINILLR